MSDKLVSPSRNLQNSFEKRQSRDTRNTHRSSSSRQQIICLVVFWSHHVMGSKRFKHILIESCSILGPALFTQEYKHKGLFWTLQSCLVCLQPQVATNVQCAWLCMLNPMEVMEWIFSSVKMSTKILGQCHLQERSYERRSKRCLHFPLVLHAIWVTCDETISLTSYYIMTYSSKCILC